jgi:hypothetical protein
MTELLKLGDTITPELSRSVRVGGGDLPIWLLAGPLGVVTYRPAGRTSLIDLHAIAPQYHGDEPVNCHLFAGCHHDAGTGGEVLARVHAEKGDEAVWAALEDWYESITSAETPAEATS